MTLPQGDLRLLETDTARRLLHSRELAHLAYVGRDGTPRVMPMMFLWTGTTLVMSTFGGAHKIASLRAAPAAAVTIDVGGPPPEVLLLRGPVEVQEVDGVLPDYVTMQRHYYGDEQAERTAAEIDRPGLRMARLALTPTWAGVLDFRTRLPHALSRS
ncbi:pyridoxamine 5'-phosphate oxidase family protein [Actinocorallia longicatena]|uniref:Pyridoxamine 5'-phosphate oxidase family protein n=1 Tax=Actinocorallia longicatena TaxID=111803 RepID=A0ABP6QIM5_9ACTN